VLPLKQAFLLNGGAKGLQYFMDGSDDKHPGLAQKRFLDLRMGQQNVYGRYFLKSACRSSDMGYSTPRVCLNLFAVSEIFLQTGC
jgi:hypothetical protein